MDISIFTGLAETARRDIGRLQAEIRDRTDALAGRTLLAEAVVRLRDSWSDGDPGKYRPHWFFVRRYAIEERDGRRRVAAYEKFWAREFASDLAAAEQRCRHGQLATFADCKRERCGSCGAADGAAVIGRYRQTEDGIDGDSWEIQLFGLCAACTSLTPLGDDFKAVYHY